MNRIGWRNDSWRHSLAAKGVRTTYLARKKKEYMFNKTSAGNVQVGSPGSDQRRAQEAAERYGLNPEKLMSEARLRKEKYGKGKPYPGEFEVDMVRLAKEMKMKELDEIDAMASSSSSTSTAIKEARRKMSLSDEELRKEEFQMQQKINREGIRNSGWSQNERQIMQEAEERADRNMLYGVETPEECVEGISRWDPDYQEIKQGLKKNPNDVVKKK